MTGSATSHRIFASIPLCPQTEYHRIHTGECRNQAAMCRGEVKLIGWASHVRRDCLKVRREHFFESLQLCLLKVIAISMKSKISTPRVVLLWTLLLWSLQWYPPEGGCKAFVAVAWASISPLRGFWFRIVCAEVWQGPMESEVCCRWRVIR